MGLMDSRFVKWLSEQFSDDGIYGPAKAISMIILVAYFLPEMVAGIQKGDFTHAFSFGILSLCAIILLVGIIKESDERRYRRMLRLEEEKDKQAERQWNERRKEEHNAYREYLRDMQKKIIDAKYNHMVKYYGAKMEAVNSSVQWEMRECLKTAAVEALSLFTASGDPVEKKIKAAGILSQSIDRAVDVVEGKLLKERELIDAFDLISKELDHEVVIAINNGAARLAEADEEFRREEERKAQGDCNRD